MESTNCMYTVIGEVIQPKLAVEKHLYNSKWNKGIITKIDSVLGGSQITKLIP